MFKEIKRGFNYSIGRFIFRVALFLLITLLLFLFNTIKSNAWSMPTAGNVACNNGHIDYTNPSNANWRQTSGEYGVPAIQWFKELYNVNENSYCWTNSLQTGNRRYISYIDFDHDGSNETLLNFGDTIAVTFYKNLQETAGSSITKLPPNEPLNCSLYVYDYAGNFVANGPSCFIEFTIPEDSAETNDLVRATYYYTAYVEGPYRLESGKVYKLRVNFTQNYYAAQLGTWSLLSVKPVSNFDSIYKGLTASDSSPDCGVICKLTHLPENIYNAFSSGFSSIISSIMNLPSLIWNALSGGFSSITSAISNIGSLVWNGISSGLGTLFTNLGNFIKSIFIPDNFTWLGLWTDDIQPLYNAFVGKLGVIGLPFQILEDFVDTFISFQPQNEYILNIPDIKDPIYNTTIISSTSINFSSFVSSGVLKTMYDFYLVIVDCIAVFGLSSFSYKKFQDIFEG